MKKLITLINLQSTNYCQELEVEYKITRKTLERYKDNIKAFKLRLSSNADSMNRLTAACKLMCNNQTKSKKKITEIDYFMTNGLNVFGGVFTCLERSTTFYAGLFRQLVNLEERIISCLTEKKKSYERQNEDHKKNVKQYVSRCFPETNSVLFKLGFMDVQKVQKEQDSSEEDKLIAQSQRYSSYLNQTLEEMQSLREQTLNIGRSYCQGARDCWIDNLDDLIKRLQNLSINEQQLGKIAEDAGQALTDRSANSNKDDQMRQDDYNDEYVQNIE